MKNKVLYLLTTRSKHDVSKHEKLLNIDSRAIIDVTCNKTDTLYRV